MTISHITAKSPYHEKNQDSYSIGDNYVIVADGMGGESDGDIASLIAVDSICTVLDGQDLTSLSENEIQDLTNNAVLDADRHIADYITEHPDSVGMGTTVLIAIYNQDSLFLCWCGDSRCYMFRDGKVRSLTKDHSYVQELIDMGKLTVEKSFTHPDNNLITRFVGGGEDACLPDFASYRMEKDGIYVLCSDGLSGYCQDDGIRRCIKSNGLTPELPGKLMQLARANGSDDDITIVAMGPESHNSGVFARLKALFTSDN